MGEMTTRQHCPSCVTTRCDHEDLVALKSKWLKFRCLHGLIVRCYTAPTKYLTVTQMQSKCCITDYIPAGQQSNTQFTRHADVGWLVRLKEAQVLNGGEAYFKMLSDNYYFRNAF